MMPRQLVSSDVPQQPMDDDEQVSVPGEGDEIMEEPEEQEDGYSTSIPDLNSIYRLCCCSASLHPPTFFVVLLPS